MAEHGFEKDLERLEEIVQALEEGELTLDDSLKRFEEGIRLAQRCNKALTTAEKRIEILTKKADGSIEAEPFGAEEEEPVRESEPGDAEAADDETPAGAEDALLF